MLQCMTARLQPHTLAPPRSQSDPSWLHGAVGRALEGLVATWFFEWGVVLRFASVDGEARCSCGVGVGVTSARLGAEAIDGRDIATDLPIPSVPGAYLPASLPARVRAAIAKRPGQFTTVALNEESCGPLPRGPQVWALFFSGDVLLGALGLGRVRGPQRIPAAMREKLDRVIVPFADEIAVLCSAPTAERTPLHLVMTPSGRVELVSQGDGMWAVPRYRRTAILRAVHLMALNQRTTLTTCIDGWEARLTRLRGDGRDRIHVTLTPGRPWSRPRATALSPRQAEVAERAARGSTVAQIADTLGLSPHTTKHHLKRAYRALGVTNRVGLAQALAEDDQGAND